VLVQVLLKWLTLLLDIYYSKIITSGNISDGKRETQWRVVLVCSGVKLLRLSK
jgi:hypothetical protein